MDWLRSTVQPVLSKQLTNSLTTISSSERLTKSLTIVGAVVVTYKVVKLSLSIFSNFKAFVLAPCGLVGVDLKTFGTWAVVTGATDGIGKGYAIQLAKRGFNIVLISRSQEKLNAVANEIEAEYKVKTKCLEIDFTQGLEIYEKIEAALADLDIGVLVNNVAIRNMPGYFCEVENSDNKVLTDLLNVNCRTITLMTRIVLPRMMAKKRGAVVNISAPLGLIPTPRLAVYAATKAYVEIFSRSIAAEYKSKGIIVQTVLPGFTATAFTELQPFPFVIPDGTGFAKTALATVGVQDRTAGYFSHIFVLVTLVAMPEFLRNRVCDLFLAKMGAFLQANMQTRNKRN